MKRQSVLVLVVVLSAFLFCPDKNVADMILDTGIKQAYQGKSTHNYEDYYTYYAQSFKAPEEWLLNLEIPVYDNQNNPSKVNPSFSVELWDDNDNVLAASSIYTPPTNSSDSPQFYSLETTNIDLVVGEKYWAVYNPYPVSGEESWCGFYEGQSRPNAGYYSKQYFAPGGYVYDTYTCYAFRATFNSQPIPDPELVPVPSAVILGSIGLTFSGWLLHKRRML